MTKHDIEVKERNLEMFNNVVALYYILKSNNRALKLKHETYRAGEVIAQPLDFLLDIEIKSKRLLGEPLYYMLLRTIANESTDVLSETMRESLGNTFREYSLGPDGHYAKLYFAVKNAQVRSFMKGQNGDTNGIFRATDNGDDPGIPSATT
jgi:hypothetical protein